MDSRLENALGLLNEAITDSMPLAAASRTCAEVLRLILVNDRSSALKGAEVLVKMLEKAA